MRKPNKVFVMSMAVFGAYLGVHAYAATAPGALSQYGQIQAVKNYSSNPYWNPNSPYNQKAIPKAIYVDGADLTTEDCNRIVGGLVSDWCSLNNNCSNMRLADVRPTIMVQLSQLPGHNYATACSGYIDAAFDKYAQTGSTLTLPLTTNTNTNHYTFQNPYAPKLNAYQAGVLERTKELEQLQAQNATSAQIGAADFPKTVADLSFTDRMANAAAGYEPYKNLKAYKIPKFEDENDEKFLERLQKNNPTEYCKRFPTATVDGKECKCVLDPDDPECKICSDPTHMDENCECLNQPQTTKNASGLCVCVNGEAIDKNCEKQTPPPTNCSDPAHMDPKNCECMPRGKTTKNNAGRCECTNGGDINKDCTSNNEEEPDTDGKVYALLQCRVKPNRLQNNIFVGTGKTMSDPARALECAGTPGLRSMINNIDKCFSQCYGGSNRTNGIVNTLTANIFDFCAGNQYGNNQGNLNTVVQNVYFFSTISPLGSLAPLEMNNLQATDAIEILKQNTSTTAATCTDSRRYWIVYLLQKTPDNQWIALDSVTIGGIQR